jgi:hypothetical protein
VEEDEGKRRAKAVAVEEEEGDNSLGQYINIYTVKK